MYTHLVQLHALTQKVDGRRVQVVGERFSHSTLPDRRQNEGADAGEHVEHQRVAVEQLHRLPVHSAQATVPENLRRTGELQI
jgi:hypothetical protein